MKALNYIKNAVLTVIASILCIMGILIVSLAIILGVKISFNEDNPK